MGKLDDLTKKRKEAHSKMVSLAVKSLQIVSRYGRCGLFRWRFIQKREGTDRCGNIGRNKLRIMYAMAYRTGRRVRRIDAGSFGIR